MNIRLLVSLLLVSLSAACAAENGEGTGAVMDLGPKLTLEQLKDPEQCKDCHPQHYKEWSGSMHAYSSEDPVFRAMNARGQQEVQLGDFCVKCHAPMAVREGKTTDGLNLHELPKHLQGVTCYFCHSAVGLGSGEPHNNPIELASDGVMRGSIKEPDAVQHSVHEVGYSRLFDRDAAESSAMCGSCHDIVTPKNVHLERTFAEYKSSIFANPASRSFDSCQGCHMDSVAGTAAVVPAGKSVPFRGRHEHLWPAVDVALTPFPLDEVMRVAVEQCLPNGVVRILFESNESEGPGVFKVSLESNAGHNVPSGASQDRRMWLEVTSFDKDGKVLFQSGAIADNQLESTASPDTWMFHDRIFNEQGKEVHMFWDAAPSAMFPTGFLKGSLPVPTPGVSAHTLSQNYTLSPNGLPPARALIRLRMRPMSLDVLQDLVQSGHLDPSIPARMPTFTMRATEVIWKDGNDPRIYDERNITGNDCRRYACLLQEGATLESCGIPMSQAATPVVQP